MNLHRILIGALFLFGAIAPGYNQDKPAYLLYSGEGKEVKYSKLIKAALESDFVFFGEIHDDPIAHWLELEITKDLYAGKTDNLILGAEMFEADDQLIISEYLKGLTDDKRYEEEGKLWKNYKTDYKPVIQFAREKKIPFVATNIPRRYASLVSFGGFDTLRYLSAEAFRYMAPLPIRYDPELKCYKDMLSMSGGHGAAKMNSNFPMAQAMKDATMAWFISQNWKPGNLFFHINGSYHSDNHQGIVWHLNAYRPGTKVITISLVEQDDVNSLLDENKGTADYIFVVPSTMTRTY
jgi:uncharacterized iron-regulated protein